ncbi:MAG: carboxypeptidase-like regulatory domain-containing protein [Polyangia bacterium]
MRFPLAIVLALVATPALAQAPTQPGGATSAPLFVDDLPTGTISVRLSRPTLTEAIPGVPVMASWTTPDGRHKSTMARTGSDGRATFSGVPVGSTFTAQTTVEGEHLLSAHFAVPSAGGTRLLMIVGPNAVAAMNAMTGGVPGADATPAEPAQPQVVGVRSGKVTRNDDLPAGSVDLSVVDATGQPLPGVKVSLGRLDRPATEVEFVDAVSDKAGRVHFAKLPAGSGAEYAAVIAQDGLRLGTLAFTLDSEHGAAGELRIPARTKDPSVLRVSARSRVMVEPREEAVGVLENLVLENASDQVFDPGPAGLFIPLPAGFTGAEKLPGGAEIDIKEGAGALLHLALPPTQSPDEATQVRVGYLLTSHEDPDLEIAQPMPMGMEGGFVLVPTEYGITLSAPGLRTRPPERDENGDELGLYDLDRVPAGQALRLTVHGLPAHDRAGKWIAGLLVALLVAAGAIAVAWPRPPKSPAPAELAGSAAPS